MKKFLRNSVACGLLAVTVGSLASCGGRHEIEFWGSFGAAYSNFLESIVADIAKDTGYDINYSTKGSYEGIQTAVNSSLSTGDYPNLMTGYPDHFAGYLGNDILIKLNDYVAAYDKAHQGESLLDDYYEDYMNENWELDIIKDDEGKFKEKALSALPFNKSTELMGYNGTFVDYCATINPELGIVPKTWQEWKTKGPLYRAVLETLVKKTSDTGETLPGGEGHVLYFNQEVDGTAKDFSIDVKGERTGMLDFREVDIKETRVISWDSTDNMFITLIRQWGSEYTSLPDSEKTKDPRRRIGEMLFNNSEYRAKTVECLKFFNELNTDKVFGTSSILGSSYSSDAFAANKVMFMLCSSGGLSYNTTNWNNRFRVAPLPYYDDGVNVRKFVISQGADIALSNYGDKRDDHTVVQHGFDTMVALTRGEYQARWCLNTGYYPCSKSATNSAIYQEFLNDKSYDDPSVVAFREGSVLNESVYMKKDVENPKNNWVKFVDPAFMGSSKIRTEVKKVFDKVFSQVKLIKNGEEYTLDPTNKSTYEQILKECCEEFKNESHVHYEGK